MKQKSPNTMYCVGHTQSTTRVYQAAHHKETESHPPGFPIPRPFAADVTQRASKDGEYLELKEVGAGEDAPYYSTPYDYRAV